jgi:hypothetical protein
MLVAAMALSAMMASSALATTGEWFVNGSKLAGKATVALANTAAVDTSTTLNDPSLGIKITCSGSLLEGKKPYIQAPNTGGAEALIFTGCSEIAPTTCTIQSKVETEPVVASLETSTSPPSSVIIRFTPKSSTSKTFATLDFSGSCAESGEQAVDGSVAAQSQNGQVEQTTHPLEGVGMADGNNSLELFKGKAYLEGGKALLKLESGKTWSFHS